MIARAVVAKPGILIIDGLLDRLSDDDLELDDVVGGDLSGDL